MTEQGGCEQEMPQPTPEHGKLLESVGTWNVKGKFYMGGPDAPPMESSAKETVTALGQFWVQGRFEGEMLGMPFEGRALVGFDPWKKQYVSTWCDSMSPAFFHMTGTMEGDVLTMEGDGVDPGSGLPAHYKTVEEHPDPNTRNFAMFVVPPGGPDIKMFEMEYKRA